MKYFFVLAFFVVPFFGKAQTRGHWEKVPAVAVNHDTLTIWKVEARIDTMGYGWGKYGVCDFTVIDSGGIYVRIDMFSGKRIHCQTLHDCILPDYLHHTVNR
jgi:hypothetical protein